MVYGKERPIFVLYPFVWLEMVGVVVFFLLLALHQTEATQNIAPFF